VTFIVTDGIRGVRSGEEFRLALWPGLWPASGGYRVGEAMVLMLHKPDGNGVTSTVGGTLGRIDLNNTNSVKLDDVHRRAMARSKRLAPLLADAETGSAKTIAAEDLLRALREIAASPAW
jgi:hypothetical protein